MVLRDEKFTSHINLITASLVRFNLIYLSAVHDFNPKDIVVIYGLFMLDLLILEIKPLNDADLFFSCSVNKAGAGIK